MEGNKKKDFWKIERSKAPKRRKKIKWIEKKHQQQNLVQHSLFAPSKITSRNEKEHHIISIISENQPVSQTYPMKKKSFLLKSRTCVSLCLFAFWWTSFMTVNGPDPIQANTSIANGKRTSGTREIFLSSSFRSSPPHYAIDWLSRKCLDGDGRMLTVQRSGNQMKIDHSIAFTLSVCWLRSSSHDSVIRLLRSDQFLPFVWNNWVIEVGLTLRRGETSTRGVLFVVRCHFFLFICLFTLLFRTEDFKKKRKENKTIR